jgi:serine protease AprX
MIDKFTDVRNMPFGDNSLLIKKDDVIDYDTLITLTFNERTNWSNKFTSKNLPNDLIELGKTPGLNIKSLHDKGITGKNITLAIIDQPLNLDHPEYKGKIIKYKNFCINNNSSMHGPAVASLLVGNNIGVAPDTKLYYAAVPCWERDAIYEVNALKWIIEENEKLDDNDKIRIVSVSAAPSSQTRNKNNELWQPMVSLAKEKGILVIDCTQENYNIYSSFYDVEDINNFDTLTPGFTNDLVLPQDMKKYKNALFVPTSRRTVAEVYHDNVFSYTYCGVGGLSWGIPYLVGVLALGLQLNSNIKSEEAIKLLYENCYNKDEACYIFPERFIESILKMKNITKYIV